MQRKLHAMFEVESFPRSKWPSTIWIALKALMEPLKVFCGPTGKSSCSRCVGVWSGCDDFVSKCPQYESISPLFTSLYVSTVLIDVYLRACYRQAKAVDDRIARGEDVGPLAGVPVAVKVSRACD